MSENNVQKSNFFQVSHYIVNDMDAATPWIKLPYTAVMQNR